jgi:ribosomal protein L11 methyltransferase
MGPTLDPGLPPSAGPAGLAGAQATGATAWWRLELVCAPELEESLLWKLPTLGITRVALSHRPEGPQRRLLLAWLPESDWPAPERAELAQALAPLGAPFGLSLPPLEWHRQEDEDWSLSWKQHWQADPVGQSLLILPAWLEAPAAEAHRRQIRMDPGSAFGTGSHPSTRLCLEALEDLAEQRGGLGGAAPLAGLRVADLGCGSGILALAALRLGASQVAAVDTDSLAIRATTANALLNDFTVDDGSQNPAQLSPAQLSVALGSASTLETLLEGRPADLLLCNILAPVIEALSPCFARLLAPAGVGFLSGLLVDQAPALEKVLAAQGWRAQLVARQESWGLMRLEIRADVA